MPLAYNTNLEGPIPANIGELKKLLVTRNRAIGAARRRGTDWMGWSRSTNTRDRDGRGTAQPATRLCGTNTGPMGVDGSENAGGAACLFCATARQWQTCTRAVG
uniref:Uncharacterized protein n=1 Tax=Oryza nivara TaxID=4536 RepID=A0A0E0FGC3_ORYNI